MKPIAALAILLLAGTALTACADRNRAVTGGVIGGTVGTASGGPVAGAVGALAGASIGASLDRQQKALEQGLGDSGATIVNTGQTLVVTLPEQVTFDVGSAELHPDYVDEIAFIARILRENPQSNVRVLGHTDNTGSTSYNQRLSERRAAAVTEILVANGVAAGRITTFGASYHLPVARNDTPGGRAQNRRVEIVITPIAPPA